ncbi:histidine phosphatase family protein [Microbacterium sediminis]|nr:histidine phosphatase family protein [Microbacterium sediminis]
MTLALVRHGRTEWNRQRRMQGRADIPLDDHGRAQADAAGRLLASAVWERIVTSPLERAAETARIIRSHLGEAEWLIDEDLVERDYGRAEGMAVAEAAERWPDQDYPGAESLAHVALRGAAALSELLDAGRDAVVVAHGTLLRVSVDALTGQVCPRILNGEVILLDRDTTGCHARRLTG